MRASASASSLFLFLLLSDGRRACCDHDGITVNQVASTMQAGAKQRTHEQTMSEFERKLAPTSELR
jgi:hypothetical protein